MNIKPFLVEEWMNEYEVGAKYNIAETCVDSVSLDELFALTGGCSPSPGRTRGPSWRSCAPGGSLTGTSSACPPSKRASAGCTEM